MNHIDQLHLDEEGLEDLEGLQLLGDAHPVEVVEGEAGYDPGGVGEVGGGHVNRSPAIEVCKEQCDT